MISAISFYAISKVLINTGGSSQFIFLSYIYRNNSEFNPLFMLLALNWPVVIVLIIFFFQEKLGITIRKDTLLFILLTTFWSLLTINIISDSGNNIYFVAMPFIICLPFVIAGILKTKLFSAIIFKRGNLILGFETAISYSIFFY